MQVETFSALTEEGLSKKVNRFLNSTHLEVIDIKFTGSFFYFAAMIIYKEEV